MTHPSLRRAVLPGCVLLTLALVYLIAWTTGPGPAGGRAAARTVPVTAVTRDCPPPGPATGQAHVAMLSSAPRDSRPAASAPRAGTPRAGKTPAATALSALPSSGSSRSGSGNSPAATAGPATPGVLSLLSPPQASQSPGTEVTATGPMAPGFEAEQAGADGTGLVACGYPRSDMWFVGTGTQDGGSATWLYLMNSGSMAASADVTVLTDAGVQSAQDNQVTVPPHRYLGVNVASQAGGSAVLAVHVQASSGQVAADVWQDGGSGGAWLPEASSPATRLVVPGVTAAGGAAKLLVAVPGNTDAQVRVTAVTARGKKSQPLGTASQDASGGAVSSFQLSSASAAALVISSSVPVTAGVQVPGNGIGGFTAAAEPVTGQGVVAGNPSGGGDTVGLVLSAPGSGARAAVTVVPASNPERIVPSPQQTVTVPGGRTAEVAVRAPRGSKGPFAIVVTPLPGSGPLYAVRTVTSGGLTGPLKALLPVPSAKSEIQLPAASGSYSAVVSSAG